MNAVVAMLSSRAAARPRFLVKLVGIVAALGFATSCTTSESGGPSNQAMGTVMGAAVGGAVGGLAFGSVGGAVGGALVGALAGNLVGRALDNQERARVGHRGCAAVGPQRYVVASA